MPAAFDGSHTTSDGLFGLRRDAVAGLHAAIDQHVRDLACARDQIAIADVRAIDGFDRKPFRVIESVEQAGKQIGVLVGRLRVHASFRSARCGAGGPILTFAKCPLEGRRTPELDH
jgi:hypothetical protein